jgi:hypothetical protein
MRIVVYVLCHDTRSRDIAEATFGTRAWARIVVMPDTQPYNKYLEAAVYLHVLEERRHEWADADFVGTLSWKAPQKIQVPVDLPAMCEQAKDADVIALYPWHGPMFTQACQCHPRFAKVWIPMLESMGFSSQDCASPDITTFFCNYWLARPAWMDRYMKFAHEAFGAMESLQSIQAALWAPNSDDPTYVKMPRQRAMEVYGVPHVPLHAYIFERLPCFFFWKHKARVWSPNITYSF